MEIKRFGIVLFLFQGAYFIYKHTEVAIKPLQNFYCAFYISFI